MRLLRQACRFSCHTKLQLVGFRKGLILVGCRARRDYSVQVSRDSSETIPEPLTAVQGGSVPQNSSIDLLNVGPKVPSNPSAIRRSKRHEKQLSTYTFKLGQYPLVYMYEAPNLFQQALWKSKAREEDSSSIEESKRESSIDDTKSTPST